MKSDLDLAQTLGVKAGNDLKMAEIGLEHAAPLDTVAFHLQQNAEKMLKALLASRRIDYPRTPRVRWRAGRLTETIILASRNQN